MINLILSFLTDYVIRDELDHLEEHKHGKHKNEQESIDDLYSIKNFDKLIIIPFKFLLILAWWIIYWQGTKFDQLFSNKIMTIVSILGLFDIFIHSYVFYLLYHTGNIDKKTKLFNLISTNILNQSSVYLRYYLIGSRLSCYTLFDQDFDKPPAF